MFRKAPNMQITRLIYAIATIRLVSFRVQTSVLLGNDVSRGTVNTLNGYYLIKGKDDSNSSRIQITYCRFQARFFNKYTLTIIPMRKIVQ